MTYEIYITRACNARCPSCAALCNIINTHNYDMTEDEVKAILYEINGLDPNINTIRVIGGEPTLHPKCYEICRLIKEVCPEAKRYSFATNFSNPDLVKRVVDELGYQVVDYIGSHDYAVANNWKKNNHWCMYVSPKEAGLPESDPVYCSSLGDDCGVSVRKLDGQLGWTWCAWGTTIAMLLRRTEFIHPTLKSLMRSGFDTYANEICKNCMHNVKNKPLLAVDAQDFVSDCFEQGLSELKAYGKSLDQQGAK